MTDSSFTERRRGTRLLVVVPLALAVAVVAFGWFVPRWPFVSQDETQDETEEEPAVVHGADIGLANTGPRTNELEERQGSITTSHDGQVIEGLRVHGTIKVVHADVVIRDVEVVKRDDGNGIYTPTGDAERAVNTRVEWTHVDGRGSCEGRGILLYGHNATVYRSSVVGKGSGGMLTDGDRWIESYSGDREAEVAANDCHGSGLSTHGARGIQVVRSNLDMGESGSSALSLYARLDAVEDALIQDNLFNGGSYCTYAGANKEHQAGNHHIRYLGNQFGRNAYDTCGEYGPMAHWNGDQPGNEWADNIWQDTGQPVEP